MGVNLEVQFKVDEHQIVVSNDYEHQKTNALHCLVEIPFMLSALTASRDIYYLCFSCGEKELDLQSSKCDYNFSIITAGWSGQKFKHGFTVNELQGCGLALAGGSTWATNGVLLQPAGSSGSKTSIDLTLTNIINFVEGDARICLYKLTKTPSGTQYQLLGQQTMRKRKSPLEIVEFRSDKALALSGEKVTFTYALRGEKTYRIVPFMADFRANIPPDSTHEINESTDAVLMARNYDNTQSVPEAERATVEKALRIAVSETVIDSFLVAPADNPGQATDDLTVDPGQAVQMSWSLIDLGAREFSIEPVPKGVRAPFTSPITFTPDDDCTYTLKVKGGSNPSQQVSVKVDDVRVYEFKADRDNIRFGEEVWFHWKLKNAGSAEIDQGIGALNLADGAKVVALKQNKKSCTYKLTCTGRIKGGQATATASQELTINVTDIAEIKAFEIKTDHFNGNDYIKVLQWSIDYPGDEVDIRVIVDGADACHFTSKAELTHTVYDNIRFNSYATLVFKGANNQTVQLTKTK